jgi:hypothetical protein
MKYLCLVFLNEPNYLALSGAESQALDDAAIEYAEALQNSGHFSAGSALDSRQPATTVRVRDGKAVVTDGPYAETSEQVGGYLLLDTSDLDEAIALASKFPAAYLGGIEIRPLRELVFSSDPQRRV